MVFKTLSAHDSLSSANGVVQAKWHQSADSHSSNQHGETTADNGGAD